MPFPRVIPHSDGAGVIEYVGEGVDPVRVGQRVWVFGPVLPALRHGGAADHDLVALTEDPVHQDPAAVLGRPVPVGHRSLGEA